MSDASRPDIEGSLEWANEYHWAHVQDLCTYALRLEGDHAKVCRLLEEAITERDAFRQGQILVTEQAARLLVAVRNQCADNLCWLDDPEIGKALPETEFLESCRRYRNQIAGTVGELGPGQMTIAQLEAHVVKLEEALRKARNALQPFAMRAANPEVPLTEFDVEDAAADYAEIDAAMGAHE